jgi:tRNA G18 (ribose-2'-O)-methylase SpoU
MNGWTVLSTNLEKEHDIELRLPEEKAVEEEETKEEQTENLFPKPTNVSITELRLSKDDNVILVLGSEGLGVTTDINNIATHNVYIPPMLNKEMVNKSPFNLIDSLNVGVSAGILICEIKGKLI